MRTRPITSSNPADYTYIIWYEDNSKIELYAVNNDKHDSVFAMTRYKPESDIDSILVEQAEQIADWSNHV